MILFVDGQGTVLSSDVTRVYQGQNVANSLTIVAPFPITNAVSVGFELPNGVRTTNYALTPIAPIDDVKNVLGDGYSYWQWTTKNGAVTELAGTVLGQFFIMENGETIATGSFSFAVEQGTQPIIPPTPDSDTWQAILRIYNDLSAKLVNKVLNDFTVDATTGIGTKYYNDGTTATVQFPISGGGAAFESAAVTILTFTTSSWVQEADGTYSLAYSSTNTGFTDNEYIVNLGEATTENEVTGYLNRADTYFQGSDGSILIEKIETPFNGRLILLGKAVLEGQLVSDLSLSGTTLTVTYIGGATTTISLAGLMEKSTVTIQSTDWVDGVATVSVTGMTEDAVVWVSYAESSYQAWKDAGIRCIAQGSGTLTFKCEFNSPSVAVTANIAYWG